MRYSCKILLEFTELFFSDVLLASLQNLGFEPRYYDLFWDEFTKAKRDISYSQKDILKAFQKDFKPTHIQIVNQLYDFEDKSENENYVWFKLRTNLHDEPAPETIGDTFQLQWYDDLDVLLNNSLIQRLITSQHLVYAYFYNSSDVFSQTSTNYNKYSKDPLSPEVKLKRDHVGDLIIDTSENWGRAETARSIEFMAAPKMLFGPAFDKVIDFKKMTNLFDVQKENNDIISLNLFPLEADPKDYRDVQKRFWDYLISNDIIGTYNRINDFDFVTLLKYRAQNRKKKK